MKFDDHLVAFVDLLGTREFVNSATSEDLIKILDLLRSFANRKGEYAVKRDENKDGVTLSINPAVSAFSDNIVISYQLAEIGMGQHNITVATMKLAGYVSAIAREVIDNGFLPRGSITLGGLYHKEGVVFGPALNDAHRLESTVVSGSLLAILPFHLALGHDQDRVLGP